MSKNRRGPNCNTQHSAPEITDKENEKEIWIKRKTLPLPKHESHLRNDEIRMSTDRVPKEKSDKERVW